MHKNRFVKFFLLLTMLLVAALACKIDMSTPQADQAAINTAVALTAQAQFMQMTLQAPATSPLPSAQPPTTAPPTVAAPTPTPTDEALIKQALLAKLGWNEADMEFSLSQNTGQHAQGAVKNVNEQGGAAWFAAKVNGQWVIAYIGHGIPLCSEVEPYNIPVDWISHCMDASYNTIERGQVPPPAADVYAPDPLGPAWSGMAFSKDTCYDLDVLFTASGAAADVCLGSTVMMTPMNGATFSGYADLAPPSLNTCKAKALTADPLSPNSDLYLCFKTNLGKYGFFVMRDDQMLTSGYIVFDAYVFP